MFKRIFHQRTVRVVGGLALLVLALSGVALALAWPTLARWSGEEEPTAQLKGVGNVPSHITPPEQNGIEWLEPSIRGEVEPKGTSVGGERTFRWTVRVDKVGEVDLGELSLPYFDPTTDRYEIARAVLGKLTVTPRRAGSKGALNAPEGPQGRTGAHESNVTIAPDAPAE